MKALIARLEAANEGSRQLDSAIAARMGVVGWTSEEWAEVEASPDLYHPAIPEAPHYTTSLDAALTLRPEGCAVLFGIGRSKPREPLYGAVIYTDMTGRKELATAETEAGLALAVCIVALKAREAQS